MANASVKDNAEPPPENIDYFLSYQRHGSNIFLSHSLRQPCMEMKTLKLLAVDADQARSLPVANVGSNKSVDRAGLADRPVSLFGAGYVPKRQTT